MSQKHARGRGGSSSLGLCPQHLGWQWAAPHLGSVAETGAKRARAPPTLSMLGPCPWQPSPGKEWAASVSQLGSLRQKRVCTAAPRRAGEAPGEKVRASLPPRPKQANLGGHLTPHAPSTRHLCLLLAVTPLAPVIKVCVVDLKV